MSFSTDWSKWWHNFFGTSADKELTAVQILCQRYVEEMQGVQRFKQHAANMHYPQYRDKLLLMATEKSHHGELIGEQIVAHGGRLPEVGEPRSTIQNSWRSLSMALEEENRSADRLEEQLRSIQSEHPDIVKFLQRISQEQHIHRGAIRDMLMRSDAFALSLA